MFRSSFSQAASPAVRLAGFAAVLALLAAPARAGVDELALERLVSDLPLAGAVTHSGDERLFVTLLWGQVRIVTDGVLDERPFLDLVDRIPDGLGLWSIAFHPDFASNGFVFAHWADQNGDSVISRFRVAAGDPARVDPESEVELLRIPKLQTLHYGGALSFGPDRCLYVSTGDGTGLDTGPDPACAAQSLDSLEGKLLRLDVDRRVASPPFYAIPRGNPFASPGRPEIWAFGLRNPWRFSFDSETGDLWLADVGSSRREEINLQPVGAPGGRNYGWKVLEGSRCFGDRSGCGPAVPACGDPALTLPLLEYDHGSGRCAVIGGTVYRGRLLPALYGAYLYADHCSGTVWAAFEEDGGRSPRQLPFSLPAVTSFAEDADGELLITTLSDLYRLVDPALPPQGLIELDVTRLEVSEGGGSVEVAARRVGGAAGAVSVGVTAVAGTAAEGVDYLAPPAVLTWEDGDGGPRTAVLEIVDDADDEPRETLSIELGTPAGGAVLGARRRMEIAIVDDDACVAGATTLCLHQGRFRVAVEWRDFEGATGAARVVPVAADQTGLLWFFSPDNWEMMVKVLDGCGFNDRFWVFSAATTNVEYVLTVTDTATGESRTYRNPLGTSAPALTDVAAFATCGAQAGAAPACGPRSR